MIATAVLSPFVPFFAAGMHGRGPINYGHGMFGLAVWFLAMVIVSAIAGWHVNAGRDTAAQIGLTLLVVLTACIIGFGLGYAECAVTDLLSR